MVAAARAHGGEKWNAFAGRSCRFAGQRTSAKGRRRATPLLQLFPPFSLARRTRSVVVLSAFLTRLTHAHAWLPAHRGKINFAFARRLQTSRQN